MALHILPPHPHRSGVAAVIATPALRLPYRAAMTVGFIAFTIFFVGVMGSYVFHVEMPLALIPWVWRLGAAGLIGIAVTMGIWISDWLLLGRAVNERWPKARARVLSVEIVPCEIVDRRSNDRVRPRLCATIAGPEGTREVVKRGSTIPRSTVPFPTRPPAGAMKAPTFAAKPPARSATPKEPIAGVIEWRRVAGTA